MLTALGIIFGVAAVITMMAIGNGAQKEILDQMKLVGVNNIIIVPKTEKGKGKAAIANNNTENQNQENKNEDKNKGKYSPGLTLKDAEAIVIIIPTVSKVSPEVIYETNFIRNAVRQSGNLTGVSPDFFNVFNLELFEGEWFNKEQLREGKAVCIIGPVIKSKLFPSENPIGKEIKCGYIWLKVIGVLKRRDVSQSSIDNLGISDYNNSVFAPIHTLLRRFKDRSLIIPSATRSGVYFGGDFAISYGSEVAPGSVNQIDKIVVQVRESEQIEPTVSILQKMMQRRHAGVVDYEIKVPELLLKQEQRTKDIFNIVLGAIASISLLVGGIGIMNIMLASVMERIMEIGIRKAVGATKWEISLQFLLEATLLSITGGLIGIILGIFLSTIITKSTGILTIISGVSILLSFCVSASVGIIFGYMPARKAALQDPVESLRHE
jgi:putative ABC transport system permease protein